MFRSIASWIVLAATFLFVGPLKVCRADVVTWTNIAGGLFSSPTNWSPNVVPGVADSLSFNRTNSYLFNVDLPATNASAFFHQGVVTQIVSASQWLLTNEWRIGETAGATSRVFCAGGPIAVTNEWQTGRIIVGQVGTGELIMNGGAITTDWLETTNGSRSAITLANGTLNTLHGSLLNVRNTQVVLGGGNSNDFTWNIFGGTNRIITGQFDYGGLTLGGNGRASVNMNGVGTSLSVLGVDINSSNVLTIRNGAKLQTSRVQWGIGGAVGNVVIISDPGSLWTNGESMYLGMHGGGQTLIVTNGGAFRTAGGGNAMDFFDFPGSRIIVDGANSLFEIDTLATAGFAFCSPTPCQLNNLLLITNGATGQIKSLKFGSPGGGVGNIIEVASGSLWIGYLYFDLGTLSVKDGTAIFDGMSLSGGTNAVLQTAGELLVGHHGALNPGDLRIGSSISSPAPVNGVLRLGGFRIGAFSGDSGSVTITNGQAFVTNAAHSGKLIVGDAGIGSLRLTGGRIDTDILQVAASLGGSGNLVLTGFGAMLSAESSWCGNGGTIVVSNAALLGLNACEGPVGAVSVSNAVLEFRTATPFLSSNTIRVANSVISFNQVENAPLDLNDSQFLGRIQRYGQTTFQLKGSTNGWVSELALNGTNLFGWTGVTLTGGTNLLQAGSITVESNALLLASNTVSTVAGYLTNRGQIQMYNSTLKFTSAVTLTESASFQGTNGIIAFDGGVILPATDVIVPSGVIIKANALSSQGGHLILDGGSVIPGDDGTVPAGIVIQNGWVTYLDKASAPTIPPSGLAWNGWLGLELIRSTNQYVNSQSLYSGNGGYERLRLGSGSRWDSGQLSVGSGGQVRYADTSALFFPGVLRVENGGRFFDDTAAMSCISFAGTVTGAPSAWMTLGAFCVSAATPFVVEDGGQIFSQTGNISGSSTQVILRGSGTAWFATNGLTLNGKQLLVQTGAMFSASKIDATASQATVTVSGAGALAMCTNLNLAGSNSRLVITNGGTMINSNATLTALFFPSISAEVSGQNSLWRAVGTISVSTSSSLSFTNRISLNEEGTLAAAGVVLNTGTGGKVHLTVDGGHLFVTNNTGTAPLTANGRLQLNRGTFRLDNLIANSTSASQVNILGGMAEWRSSDFAAGIPLRIGSSSNLVFAKLLGGTNTLRGGLEVRRYATFAGDGVIFGAVTNRGVIKPGALTIRSNLVLDTTSELAFSLADLPGSSQNGFLSVTGTVLFGGKLSIALSSSFTPSNTNSFILLQHRGSSSAFTNIAFGQRLLTADQLSSFRIDSISTNIVATDFRSEDADGDGINDAWALQYFGSSPLSAGTGASDLDGDWDGDGLSNRNEFLLSTNPTNGASAIRISAALRSSNLLEVRFPYVSGRSYFVGSSDDLATWIETPIESFNFDLNGDAVWIEPKSLSTRRFYQLIVR